MKLTGPNPAAQPDPDPLGREVEGPEAVDEEADEERPERRAAEAHGQRRAEGERHGGAGGGDAVGGHARGGHGRTSSPMMRWRSFSEPQSIAMTVTKMMTKSAERSVYS
jgi:hypothetical protein